MDKLMLVALAMLLFCCNSINNNQDVSTIKHKDLELEPGVYFSYKKCDKNKRCQNLQPYKIKDDYYLNIYQKPMTERTYVLVKNNNYYIYSLQYLDENREPIVFWSEIQYIDSNSLSFKINDANQVFGFNYMNANFSDFNYEKSINRELVKVGEFNSQNIFKSPEEFEFNITKDGFTVNCQKYNQSMDKRLEQNSDEFGALYFYYTCAFGDQIFFKKISS